MQPMDRHLRVNIGCGPTLLPGYQNVDVDGSHFEGLTPEQVDLFQPLDIDVRASLPWETDSLHEVRADQFLEHLDLWEAAEFLAEAFRVLRPGGDLRLSFPDMEQVAAHVPPAHLKRWERAMVKFPDAWPRDLVFLNLAAYEWGHKCVLTTRAVVHVVKEVGFRILHHGHTLTTGHVLAVKGNAPNAWRTTGR